MALSTATRWRALCVAAAALTATTAGCGGGSHRTPPPTGSTSAPTSPARPGTSTPGGPGVALSVTAPGLVPGGSVTIPLSIDFAVTGPGAAALQLTPNSGYHLHISKAEPGRPRSQAFDIPIGAAQGATVIPSDPLMTGISDLTIALAGPDGRPVAAVVYPHLTIAGPK